MKKAIAILASALLLLLAACGGSSGTAPSLAVSPATATATAGDGPVSFSATLSGTSGAISWSLSPNLGTLSSNSGPSVSYTPPATVASEQTVTLTASAGSLSASATITIEPRTTDVAGIVIDPAGNPQSGKKVFIPGHQLQTSDADGKFTFSDVVVPYTVIVEDLSSRYYVYEGLTRSDPRVYVGGTWPSLPYSARVQGDVSPTNSGNKLGIQGAGDGCSFASPLNITANHTSYDINIGMYKKTAELDIYALEWTKDAHNNAASFVSLGKHANVTLADGGTFNNLNVQLEQLSAPTTHDLDVTLSPPSSLTPNQVITRVKLSPADVPAFGNITASFTSSNISNNTVTVKSPDINSVSDARMTVLGNFKDSDNISSRAWNTVPVGSSSITVSIPEPPAISAPADGATDVTTATNFAWSGPEGAIYEVDFNSSSFHVHLYTTAAEAQLPDLSAFNTSYPGNTSFNVRVLGIKFSGLYEGSVDQFVDPDRYPPFLAMFTSLLGAPLSDSGYYLFSKAISFTTAP